MGMGRAQPPKSYIMRLEAKAWSCFFSPVLPGPGRGTSSAFGSPTWCCRCPPIRHSTRRGTTSASASSSSPSTSSPVCLSVCVGTRRCTFRVSVHTDTQRCVCVAVRHPCDVHPFPAAVFATQASAITVYAFLLFKPACATCGLAYKSAGTIVAVLSATKLHILSPLVSPAVLPALMQGRWW